MLAPLATQFETLVRTHKDILLGVGPVSKNCVDASVDVARASGAPIMFIASRRQIDMEDLGGGYVNNWTTPEFADYVRGISNGAPVYLARDHGGPWQSEVECARNYGAAQAMESAKRSYEVDILSGFDLLHLDPFRAGPTGGDVSFAVFLERTKELYAHCHAFAQQQGKQVSFEIATDEGAIGEGEAHQTEAFIRDMLEFCSSEDLPPPLFAVLLTGTKVMEDRNVGPLDGWVRDYGGLPDSHALPALSNFCHRNGLAVKEHNLDYVTDGALKWHSKDLVDAVNVAPEFGIVETRALLEVCDEIGRPDLRDQFVEFALESGKWRKWMLPDTKVDDRGKAVIAGHYVYSEPEIVALKEEVNGVCESRGWNLDDRLREVISASVERYLRLLGS
jgi:hypothetical protein